MTKTQRYASMIGATCLLVMVSTPAFAYLDPGTGSALVQGLLAAFAAIAVTVKLYWHRLLRLLGLKKDQRPRTVERSTNTKTQSTNSQAGGPDQS